jgi:mercuric ion transport protein
VRVELIYFRGCPHVDEARANLRAALDAARVDTAVAEWERDDSAAPSYVRGYASPTILVDGRDVSGAAAPVGGASCRAGGAPTIDRIQLALVAT